MHHADLHAVLIDDETEHWTFIFNQTALDCRTNYTKELVG
jgi:hypothetical protein